MGKDLLEKTGVPIKVSGDGLSHKDINSINSTVNTGITAINELLKTICNLNQELGDFNRKFTLPEAAGQIPKERRQRGLQVRFLSVDGEFLDYIFIGGEITDLSWIKEDNWSIPFAVIDGGEW